jgi:hypothetical protein
MHISWQSTFRKSRSCVEVDADIETVYEYFH